MIDEPVRRRDTRKKEFRHAYSEMLPDEVPDDRRRSQAMIDVKAHAFKRLKDELQIAQTVCYYGDLIEIGPRQANLCLRAFRRDKF